MEDDTRVIYGIKKLTKVDKNITFAKLFVLRYLPIVSVARFALHKNLSLKQQSQ